MNNINQKGEILSTNNDGFVSLCPQVLKAIIVKLPDSSIDDILRIVLKNEQEGVVHYQDGKYQMGTIKEYNEALRIRLNPRSRR